MRIPSGQLDIWGKQIPVVQSRDTYAVIRKALMSTTATYRDRRFDVFLQVPYGNDTNVFTEGDIVIVCRGAFFSDKGALSPEDADALNKSHPNATYLYAGFKSDVERAHKSAVGSSVAFGTKAIRIEKHRNRR